VYGVGSDAMGLWIPLRAQGAGWLREWLIDSEKNERDGERVWVWKKEDE